MRNESKNYWWWKTSCTTWYVVNLIIYKVNHLGYNIETLQTYQVVSRMSSINSMAFSGFFQWSCCAGDWDAWCSQGSHDDKSLNLGLLGGQEKHGLFDSGWDRKMEVPNTHNIHPWKIQMEHTKMEVCFTFFLETHLFYWMIFSVPS